MNILKYGCYNFDFSKVKPDDAGLKIREIERKLAAIGLFPNGEREIVKCIEDNHLDVSQFDFPCGSFEVFKTDVSNGKYDFDMSILSDDERNQLFSDFDGGKFNVTY